MNRIYTIYSTIEEIPIASRQMHDYINSLSENDYALLATVFVLGRSGWHRGYEETNEYHIFVENKASDGIQVNQQMSDDKFLSKANKKEQFDATHQYERLTSSKVDGVYRHNWLSLKTNLISEVKKGLVMLEEITD
ncbi:hypothetical protein [Agarilytica rhodophyticola]|uniref:hypothetical protein n=1 Tax=Agarilytica rhodophyticola TaxID=1737490 RepID=UPI000CD98341|nr:hypothetical protein [Agarilytica rhodophyticola]